MEFWMFFVSLVGGRCEIRPIWRLLFVESSFWLTCNILLRKRHHSRKFKGKMIVKWFVLFSAIANFITSRRGNQLILLSGYTFYKFKTSKKQTSMWMCSTHRGKGCKAVVHTVNDRIISLKKVHNHPPIDNTKYISKTYYQAVEHSLQ